jgi:hypothetical protein
MVLSSGARSSACIGNQLAKARAIAARPTRLEGEKRVEAIMNAKVF